MFPSPVIALGSQHTVNEAIIAENGTVLQLAGLNKIFGLEERCATMRTCHKYISCGTPQLDAHSSLCSSPPSGPHSVQCMRVGPVELHGDTAKCCAGRRSSCQGRAGRSRACSPA